MNGNASTTSPGHTARSTERRLTRRSEKSYNHTTRCPESTRILQDHSTFSKNRHGRFRDSDLLRHVFETVVARCIAEGLVSGQRLAVDANLIAADTNLQNSSPQSEWQPDKIDPEDAPRAVREYLATLDDAAFGAATPVQPKFTSHSDPVSQWTAARKGPAFFAYSASYMVDTDHAVILDVEATRSVRQAELGAMQTMLDRTNNTSGVDLQTM